MDYKGVFLLGSQWSKITALSLQNPFWKDVFSSWVIFLRTVTPMNDLDKLSVPLWYNKDISQENMYFANWAANGVLFPVDIIQEDGNLMTLTDIQTHFDLSINFLDYYRVRLNLEKFIKHTNIENFQIKKPFLPYYLKFVCGNVKSNKFYRIINQNYDNNTLRSEADLGGGAWRAHAPPFRVSTFSHGAFCYCPRPPPIPHPKICLY